MNLLRQAPAAPERCEFSSSSAAASGTPPQSRQISSARAIQASSGWSADSNVSINTASSFSHGDVGQRLARLEQPAVGRIEASLRDATHCVGAGMESS